MDNLFFVKYLQLIQRKATKSEIINSLAQYKAFIPFSFSLDKEKNKIQKKPLIKWKDEKEVSDSIELIKRISVEYNNGFFAKGVGINLINYNIVVIDIDNISDFERNFGSIKEFLKEITCDAFLIVKTLQKGFHIYLSKKAVEKIINLNEISGKEPLERWDLGFELRFGDKLIICHPSSFSYNEKLFEYKILYVNPENYYKENLKQKTLINLFSLIKKQINKEQKLQTETLLYKKNRDKEINQKYSDFKELIQQIKTKVSFKDIIPNYFAKRYFEYDAYHCPFHQPDKTPSFCVKNWGDGEIAKDFHNDKSYDVISFYEEYYQVDFKKALKKLADIAGIKFTIKQKKKAISVNISQFNYPIETEKGVYSPYFAISKIKKRYGMLKNEKEIWEIEEKQKIFVSKTEYLADLNSNYDIYLYDERESPNNQNEKVYSYLILNPIKQIAFFVINEGMEYKDPLFQEEQKYNLTITTRDEEIRLENITTLEFYNFLKQKFLIASHQKIKDALATTLNFLKEKKIIKQNFEITRAGFYYLEKEKRIISSKLKPQNVKKEELAEALRFLNSLITNHYKHVDEKFVTILKWFIIAPFTFLTKQNKNSIKGLYLYGASGTGKSTMCLLLANIWADFYRPLEKTGASIDTLARLGKALSGTVFPEIISEPQGALNKEEIVEAIKNALTNINVRDIHIQGKYVSIYALANIVFTSNHFLPNDDALLRRFIVISFSKAEKPQIKENFAHVKREASKLLPLIGSYLVSNFDKIKKYIINEEGEIILNENNFFEISFSLLRFLYEEAEVGIPGEIFKQIETEFTMEDFEEETKALVISEIKENILKEITKIRTPSSIIGQEQTSEIRERLVELIKSQYFSFLLYKDWDGGKVFLLTKLLSVLTTKIANLKILAEILGYPYKKKSFRLGKTRQTLQVIEIPLEDFIELLLPSSDEEDFPLQTHNDNIFSEEPRTEANPSVLTHKQ